MKSEELNFYGSIRTRNSGYSTKTDWLAAMSCYAPESTNTGISDSQINLINSRFSNRLPRSYLDFLRTVGHNVNLKPWAEYGQTPTFIDPEKLGSVKYFGKYVPDKIPSPLEYFSKSHTIYGADQIEYLDRKIFGYAIEITYQQEHARTLMINPSVISEDGEWEAWDYSTQIGLIRYPSFAEMIQAIISGWKPHPNTMEISSSCGKHIFIEKK